MEGPAGLWCATCAERVDAPDGKCEHCGSPALTSHHPSECKGRWEGTVRVGRGVTKIKDPLVRECLGCHQVKKHRPRSDNPEKPKSRCPECTSAYGKTYREKNWQCVKAKNTWKGMIGRCHDPKWGEATKPGIPKYRDYGAKGVTVAKRWRGKKGFANFVKDVGLPPTRVHTLDRRNPRRNYTPSNTVWADPETQRANRKNSRWITAVCPTTAETLTKTIADWARWTGLLASTIRNRIYDGWDGPRAVTTFTPIMLRERAALEAETQGLEEAPF